MNLIIGKRSNLSQKLSQQIANCILISSDSIDIELSDIINKVREPINLIFNNFQNSILLGEHSRLDKYIENSIAVTSKILTMLSEGNVSVLKIIYTSSSSVYGNNKFCSETDHPMPTSLQASLKVANEELIKRFCSAYNIKYTITRIFNMYGGNDHFSVISKIKNSYFNHEALEIINNGTGIRDYVYIDDVVEIYNIILSLNEAPKILNIASGNGRRVVDFLNILDRNKIRIKTTNKEKDEIKASIADVSLLSKFKNIQDFVNVEDYLLKELKISKTKPMVFNE